MAGERKERGEIQTFLALLDRGAQAPSNLVLWGESTVGGREAEGTGLQGGAVAARTWAAQQPLGPGAQRSLEACGRKRH